MTDRKMTDRKIADRESLRIFHDLSRHTLTGIQFDFYLRGFRLSSQLRSLTGVPGDWRGRYIAWFVIRRSARYQPVFARRDVFQRECAVGSDIRFGIAQWIAGAGRFGGRKMNSKARRQSRPLFCRDHLPAQ